MRSEWSDTCHGTRIVKVPMHIPGAHWCVKSDTEWLNVLFVAFTAKVWGKHCSLCGRKSLSHVRLLQTPSTIQKPWIRLNIRWAAFLLYVDLLCSGLNPCPALQISLKELHFILEYKDSDFKQPNSKAITPAERCNIFKVSFQEVPSRCFMQFRLFACLVSFRILVVTSNIQLSPRSDEGKSKMNLHFTRTTTCSQCIIPAKRLGAGHQCHSRVSRGSSCGLGETPGMTPCSQSKLLRIQRD